MPFFCSYHVPSITLFPPIQLLPTLSLCPNHQTLHHPFRYGTPSLIKCIYFLSFKSTPKNILPLPPSSALLLSIYFDLKVSQEQWQGDCGPHPPAVTQPPEDHQGKLNGPTDGYHCAREGVGQCVATVPQKTWGKSRACVCMRFSVCLFTCLWSLHLFCACASMFCVCVPLCLCGWWGLRGGGGMVGGHGSLTQDVWNLLAWQCVTRLLG